MHNKSYRHESFNVHYPFCVTTEFLQTTGERLMYVQSLKWGSTHDDVTDTLRCITDMAFYVC